MVPSSPDPLPDAQPPRVTERRGETDRRTADRRKLVLVPTVERRSRGTRRQPGDRRTSLETAETHVRDALQLLMSIVDTASLDDEVRRDLDAAIFRLHFAVERLQGEVV